MQFFIIILFEVFLYAELFGFIISKTFQSNIDKMRPNTQQSRHSAQTENDEQK